MDDKNLFCSKRYHTKGQSYGKPVSITERVSVSRRRHGVEGKSDKTPYKQLSRDDMYNIYDVTFVHLSTKQLEPSAEFYITVSRNIMGFNASNFPITPNFKDDPPTILAHQQSRPLWLWNVFTASLTINEFQRPRLSHTGLVLFFCGPVTVSLYILFRRNSNSIVISFESQINETTVIAT